MSDFDEWIRAVDPLHSLESTPIDFDALKSRVTSRELGVLKTPRRRQMKVLSFATVAILVTTVTLVSVTSDNAEFHSPPPGGHSTLKAGGASVIYGTNSTPANFISGATAQASTYAPEAAPAVPNYDAGAGLSAPASGSVYKLNAFNDATSEAQRLASIFGVNAPTAPVPTKGVFAAEYEAGDMASSIGSVQYFIGGQGEPGAGLGTFQYIADDEGNWSFDGPITSTVDPATATRDLSTVDSLWRALDTGFTLSNPTWMVMQLSPESNAVTTSETQVTFTLTIDGHQTQQFEQFSFDDTGKLVYAVGPDLSITGSVTFPFQNMAATIALLNAQRYGDCSPTGVAVGTTWTGTSSNTSTTTAPVVTETLGGVSVLYQPELMSNGEPWLVPFYDFTESDGSQSSAPWISALAPAYFSVNKSATSCTMTLTQP